MVPEDGLLCKALLFPAGLSKPEAYIFHLKANRKSAANCRVNMHLPCSHSNWIFKDHFSLLLWLRISFRFHFLYRFAMIYDFQTLIYQTHP